MSRATDDQYGIDLNTALVGKDNEVEVRMTPYLEPSGESLDVGAIEYTAEVQKSSNWETHGGGPVNGAEMTSSQVQSAYKAWVQRAREQWSIYQADVQHRAIDSIRAWASRNPLMVSTTFDNEAGPDFSRIFEEAPVIEDTSRLKDYAMHLRDLMAKNDTSALFEEFRFYYAQQYKITGYDGGVEVDKASLRENVVMADPELNFTRTDVGLRRWSGGRIWEVYREGADAFFQSGSTVREVYVAEIDGDLKVVR